MCVCVHVCACVCVCMCVCVHVCVCVCVCVHQVPPAMLEDLLLGHPAVADVCVIGKPDAAAGELPMAFVVKATGKSVTEQDLKDFVASG